MMTEQRSDSDGHDPTPTEAMRIYGRRSDRQKRRGWRRVLSWWRELIAVIVIVVVGLTLTLVIVERHSAPPADTTSTSWLDGIKVSGRIGSLPVLSLDRPVTVSSMKIQTLETGDGREITTGSPLILSVASYSATTGEIISDDGRPTLLYGVAEDTDFDTTLLNGVLGHTEGSRLLFVRPIIDHDGAISTEINVVDILSTSATGKPAPDPSGPLTVEMVDAGPRMTHSLDPPPTEVRVQVLLEGEGQQVEDGDAVLVQYVSAHWNDGVVTASTWSTGIPQVIALDDAMPGVRMALLDHRVGSRLAVTIPSEMASGDDTLMMVIDILGTQPRAS